MTVWVAVIALVVIRLLVFPMLARVAADAQPISPRNNVTLAPPPVVRSATGLRALPVRP